MKRLPKSKKGIRYPIPFKIDLKMRLAILCFLLPFLGMHAKPSFAQKTITLNVKKASVFSLLEEIEGHTDYRFIYKVDDVDLTRNLSLKVKKERIPKVLDKMFRGTNVEYRIINNYVFLNKRKGFSFTAPPVLFKKEDQQIEITGTVTDENGVPLPGVNVQETGTTNGTFTDFNGEYQINVPSNESELLFSFTGMSPVSRTVGNNTQIDVVLIEDAQALSEVVIVGYGTQKRSEVTGSISNVSGDRVSDTPVQSFESSLGGAAAGVNIIANSGVLNEAPVFRIRGTNSLSLSSYPLIVVDGVPMFTSETESDIGYAMTNPLSALNPDDIESIDIAKDAAATSIYGSRAANGVVFVTTKRGKMGKAHVSYSGWIGFQKATHTLSVLNAEEYIEIKNEGLMNEGTYDPVNNFYDYSLDGDGNRIDTDWRDYIYRTGISHNHDISISGANETTRYYGSVGYTRQEGIFRKSSFDRKSVMFNVTNQTTDWLNLGAKINYTNENNNQAMATGARSATATGAMARLALMTAPIAAPILNDGTYNLTSSGFIGLQDNEGHLNQSRLGFSNPVQSMAFNRSEVEVNQIRSNVFAELSPFKWIRFKTLYGIDYRNSNYDMYFDPITNEGLRLNGQAQDAYNKRKRWVWTNTLTFDQTFADVHSFNLLLGQEQQKTDGSRFGLRRTSQTDPYFSNIQGGWQNVFVWATDGAVTDNYLASWFGRLQYNFNEKYFVTANLRQDKYSALGINNKKGVFWGFSGGWEITKENFWSNSGLNDIFSSFKIRGSYGQVGNVAGLDDFAALNTYAGTLYGGESGLAYDRTGNPDLKWETSKKGEIGIDFGFFDERLTGEITYYKNNIDGLIFGVPVAPSAGIPNSTNNTILQNVGSMYNKGFEVALHGFPFTGQDFSWSSDFNFSYNKNEVTSLADGIPSIILGQSITLPGHSVGMINAVRTAGIDPQTGRMTFLDHEGRKVFYQHVPDADIPFRWSYEDGSEAPPITPSSDAVPLRESAPKVYGGLTNTFRYKNWSLNFLLTYQLGGYLYNGTQATMRDQRFWNNSTDVLRRWQKPGDITDIARIVNGDNVSMGDTMAIDENVQSSDFLKFKSVKLSYLLPKDWTSGIGISNAMVYASALNLATWTKYKGFDPEVTTNANNPMRQGIDRNQAPNARTITLGVKVDF